MLAGLSRCKPVNPLGFWLKRAMTFAAVFIAPALTCGENARSHAWHGLEIT
jgi:hypothetical protein